MLEGEAERRGRSDQKREMGRHRPPRPPRGDQRRIRQCADQREMLALAELEPGHRQQDERPIAEHEAALRSRHRGEKPIGGDERERDKASDHADQDFVSDWT